MTVHRVSSFTAEPRSSLQAAQAHIAAQAYTDSAIGEVGLELEYHVVDRERPERRLAWSEVSQLLADAPSRPEGSRLTVEPGGQLELSTPPRLGASAAIKALQRDEAVLTAAFAQRGIGLAPLGSDPARTIQRVNPASRYVAMERHFDAMGCGPAGRAMMASTAALQLNLNAGPVSGWVERLAHLNRLAPVLIAVSACSPLLAGRSSGWPSMRQEVWLGIDQARCQPVPAAADPGRAWASYALSAPVMLVGVASEQPHATGEHADPRADAVLSRIPFGDWVAGATDFGRPPTPADLEYHLSTLFPTVRPRGYLELRCLDAVPRRWWPGLAALTVTLVDDEVAADRAAELCEPIGGSLEVAARDGLRDDTLFAAALGCLEIAAARCPADLRADAEAYVDLVSRRRTPGDDLRERAAVAGPAAALAEATHA
jgi:glutamate--cysteine ligase